MALSAEWHVIWRSGSRWSVLIALIILGLTIISALFAAWLAPHDPTIGQLSARMVPPSWLEGGSAEYLLGTDMLGRDIFSRLLHGSRISLVLASAAVGIGALIGCSLGILAGYTGGRVDSVIMRITDMALGLPMVLMAIVIVALAGASLLNILLVVSFLLWPYYARQLRGTALQIQQEDFVLLARISGCGHLRIMLRHVLPNAMPTILVLATVQVSVVILLESSLSFLGVGVPPPTPAWGLMVSEGRDVIAQAWWVSFWPGVAISMTVFAITILGDHLRDRFDPGSSPT